MKHRGQRHVHIALIQVAVSGGTEGRHGGEGVQHQLPMAETDAFGQPGGAGGKESRGAGILIKVGEIAMGWAGLQHVFVFGDKFDAGVRCGITLVDKNEFFNRINAALDRLQQWQEIAVHHQHIIFGMLDGVE